MSHPRCRFRARSGLLLWFPLMLGAATVLGADAYQLGSESSARAPGVPAGRVEPFSFRQSQVYPATERAGWVYIPAQYDGREPAALMVFQDGHAYVSTDGQMRAPIVFDNLIARGEMPVTIGVFVNPGHRGDDGPAAGGWGSRNNRSLEYDSLGDAYARFLLDELLPWVVNHWNLNVSSDPRRRAICGMSSGGICAWTAAWERPDAFGKVLSHIGSFVNIRGGHVYPALIRKTERKPIRVLLQDGSNDLNNLHGNWPLANQQLASALAFAGYDFRFEFGDGAHNGGHGGAILPDSLRWLWRPELPVLPAPLTRDNFSGDEALSKILPRGGGGHGDEWELVGEGYRFTDAACPGSEGEFYFADLPVGIIYRVESGAARPEVWLSNGLRISGMKFGSDGMLYACSQGGGDDDRKRIVVIDPATKAVETVALNVEPNDLVVTRAGNIYFTDTGAGAVVRVPVSARGMARPAPVAGGIVAPNGIALSPDGRFLLVSEYRGTNGWSFLIAPDGSLRGGERYMQLRKPQDREDSGGDGMTTDRLGRAWITSHEGIQVFDATGRLGGVVARPQAKGIVSCALAGPAGDLLYVCNADRVYRRRVLVGK
ncbi:MAG: SMP-30/gluconolactonase/LRE family protein [Verrucomicrobiales bacterium]|nr:SMP-30/gluconolactonase/LRE family protein [Verrucomicrobiales bacterium]MCP5527955.1 SMP-30/gluconolactonase/LRE family protein [Verrucomicrobiales bacterium]